MRLKKYKVCIFAYSFKHKKTNDFINLLSEKNCLDLVIATPKEKLKIKSNWKPQKKNKKFLSLKVTKDLCLEKGINYLEIKHKNIIKIKSIIKKYKINLGIVSGARIIDKKIIKLFKYGIINFHPGKIPETSGLDSFFWTIKKNIYPYVTAHFIDKYVDKGKILIQKKINIFRNDDFYSLNGRIYMEQINLLKKISFIINKNENFYGKLVTNYKKNDQLNTNEKKNIYYKEYHNWKKKLIR